MLGDREHMEHILGTLGENIFWTLETHTGNTYWEHWEYVLGDWEHMEHILGEWEHGEHILGRYNGNNRTIYWEESEYIQYYELWDNLGMCVCV